jgi:hypothetical protein
MRLDYISTALKSFIGSVDSRHNELIQAIAHQNRRTGRDAELLKFSTIMTELTKEKKEELCQLQILDLLFFPEIASRYEAIPVAFEDTFDWIFHEPVSRRDSANSLNGDENPAWNSFVNWLHSNDGLYWCTGKPGAGKSTLVKYVLDDPRTVAHLQIWSAGSPMIVAGCFLWSSGTDMQMSWMGLLQSLLFQILHKHPAQLKRIPYLFSNRWKRSELFGSDSHAFTSSELSQAFRCLVSDINTKFFFVVDGLDEVDGDYSELADLLIQVATLPNIKVCTASRSWLIFEEKFESQAKLRLHDLTQLDIKMFVSKQLSENLRFCELASVMPEDAHQKQTDVANKASGVFLWVHFVVQSLITGLRDGDTIIELQKRISVLPSDLEKLFNTMIDSIDPLYFEQASTLFQIVRAARNPPTLLTLSLADSTLEAAIHAETRPVSDDELSFLAENMKRRLTSRCGGLLEAAGKSCRASTSVEYFHRTAKDYLKRPAVWDRILSATTGFEPHSALCSSSLLQIKSLQPIADDDVVESLWQAIATCLQRPEGEEYIDRVSYLDEVDQAATRFAITPISGSDHTWLRDIQLSRASHASGPAWPHWTNTILCLPSELRTQLLSLSNKSRQPNKCPQFNSFFDFAIHGRLYYYVERKLDSEPSFLNSKILGHSLLWHATEEMDDKLMKTLLARGADPNRLETSYSPWQLLLHELSLPINTSSEDMRRRVKLFLSYSADLKVYVNGVRASVLIERYCGKGLCDGGNNASTLSSAGIHNKTENGSCSILRKRDDATKTKRSRLARFSLKSL